MWIQVRTIDGKKTARVDNLSKLTKIEDLRERLIETFQAPPSDQRLFFRGKQLVDGHTLFDYDVGLNDLIQLMVRCQPATDLQQTELAKNCCNSVKDSNSKEGAEESSGSDKENKEPDSDVELTQPSTSRDLDDDISIYKVGDIIDARDPSNGAWFEAKILEVICDLSVQQTRKKSKSVCEQLDKNVDSKDTDVSDSLLHKTDHQNSAVKLKDENCNDQMILDHDIAGLNSDNGQNLTSDKCNQQLKHIGNENDKLSHSSGSFCSSISDDCNHSILESKECETVLGQKTGIAQPGHCTLTTHSQMSDIDQKTLLTTDDSNSLKNQGILSEIVPTDGFIYKTVFDSYEDDTVELACKDVRPRARHLIRFEDVKEGQRLMVNYNYDDPTLRGFWYDCIVTKKRDTRTVKELYATVFIGACLMPVENCKLLFLNELFDIEKPGTQLTEHDLLRDPAASPVKRQNKPECDHCLDNPRRKCKHCACCVCGGKDEPEKQILCDECNQAYHLQCLNPPLAAVPEEDDWYCPDCKTDDTHVIKAGEKLKENKKKAKMASANSTSNRDWGKGMACVGRTKQCTIVPSNHYGPIPGVEVGTMWKFRVQVSEAGIHRPHVAGIHGREDDGAYSIVLSGGYEDDADNGNEFYYTGSGGRDLSGNKRTAEQSCDQKLTRMNRALAKNCNAPINDKTGTEAKDWKGGKPVRVVRNCKGRKHSTFAPEEGNRYDGIYKVVKYWAEKGKSGFLVWRYLLRRDDPAPAPWTKEGKKRCQGLIMQYPEGYLESSADKEKDSEEDISPKKSSRKRKSEVSPVVNEDRKKPRKSAAYTLDSDILKTIKADKKNKKLWDEVLDHVADGAPKFLLHLEEVFMCICCQEILYKPVTLECSHNICQSCIMRSFKAEVYSCPLCRTELAKDFSMPINKELGKVLLHFFPGYQAGRA